MEKITKKAFLDHAVLNGIALLGSRGCDLNTALEIIKNTTLDLSTITRIKCTVSRKHIKRGTYNLYLDSSDTIYKEGEFFIVHSFIAAHDHYTCDSHHCVFYC